MMGRAVHHSSLFVYTHAAMPTRTQKVVWYILSPHISVVIGHEVFITIHASEANEK